MSAHSHPIDLGAFLAGGVCPFGTQISALFERGSFNICIREEHADVFYCKHKFILNKMEIAHAEAIPYPDADLRGSRKNFLARVISHGDRGMEMLVASQNLKLDFSPKKKARTHQAMATSFSAMEPLEYYLSFCPITHGYAPAPVNPPWGTREQNFHILVSYVRSDRSVIVAAQDKELDGLVRVFHVLDGVSTLLFERRGKLFSMHPMGFSLCIEEYGGLGTFESTGESLWRLGPPSVQVSWTRLGSFRWTQEGWRGEDGWGRTWNILGTHLAVDTGLAITTHLE